MKPTEIRETAAAMLPDSCIGTQRGGGGARERASTADTFGEANTVVFLSFVNSARGSPSVSWRVLRSAPRTVFGVTGKQIQIKA